MFGEDPLPGGGTRRRPNLPSRLLAVTAASLLVWLAMGWLAENVYGAFPAVLRHALNALAVFAVAVPMVVLARRYLDRRPWSGLGLTGIGEGWRPFVVGALSWLLPALAGVALCLWLGWVDIAVNATPAELLRAVALLIVLVLVFEAFPEELVFRGYLYRNLSTAVPKWAAVLGQALLFTLFGMTMWIAIEGQGALVERTMIFLAMGVALGCVRVLTGNVWGCVGYHLAFQVVAQLLLDQRYAGFGIGRVEILTMVAFSGAFALGPVVAALLTRAQPDWRLREPDPAYG